VEFTTETLVNVAITAGTAILTLKMIFKFEIFTFGNLKEIFVSNRNSSPLEQEPDNSSCHFPQGTQIQTHSHCLYSKLHLPSCPTLESKFQLLKCKKND